MLKVFGISMRYGNVYRVMVKGTEAMNKKWLEFINKDCDNVPMTFEEALKNSCYCSNKDDYLIMEIEINLDDNSYQVMYYFNDYEYLDVEVSSDELQKCIDFINEWKNVIPDNAELMLGDAEWYEALPNTISWKYGGINEN
jgi:hypothetical protein